MQTEFESLELFLPLKKEIFLKKLIRQIANFKEFETV